MSGTKKMGMSTKAWIALRGLVSGRQRIAGGQSVSQSVTQSVGQSVTRSVTQSVTQSVSQLLGQSLHTELPSSMHNPPRRGEGDSRLRWGWVVAHLWTEITEVREKLLAPSQCVHTELQYLVSTTEDACVSYVTKIWLLGRGGGGCR